MPLKNKKPQNPNADTVASVTNQTQTMKPESNQSPLIDLKDTVNQVKPEEASIQRKAIAESTPDSSSLLSIESATAKSNDDDDLILTYKPIVRKPFTSEVISDPETFDEMALDDNERNRLKNLQKDPQNILLEGEPNQIDFALRCFKNSYRRTGDIFCKEYNALDLNRNRYEGSNGGPKPRDNLKGFYCDTNPENELGFNTVIIRNCEFLSIAAIIGILTKLFNTRSPSRIIFATNEPKKVHPIITNNCHQIICFPKPTAEQIAQMLTLLAGKAGFKISPEDARNIAVNSNGSPKNAIANLRNKYVDASKEGL